MPVLRHLLFSVARRAASDPRVQAKAKEVLDQEVKPRAKAAAQKAKGAYQEVKGEWREVVSESEPEDSRAKLAGRFVGRLQRRLSGEDKA